MGIEIRNQMGAFANEILRRAGTTGVIVAERLFRFRVQFAMRFWQKALLRSTAGSQIQDGLRFTSAANGMSSMPCG